MVRRTYWLSAIEALWREKSIVWLYRTFLHVRDYGGVSVRFLNLPELMQRLLAD